MLCSVLRQVIVDEVEDNDRKEREPNDVEQPNVAVAAIKQMDIDDEDSTGTKCHRCSQV